MNLTDYITTFYAIGEDLSHNKFAVLVFRYNLTLFQNRNINTDILQAIIVSVNINDVLMLIQEIKNCNRAYAITVYNQHHDVVTNMIQELQRYVTMPTTYPAHSTFNDNYERAFIVRVDDIHENVLLVTAVIDRW